MAVDWSCHGCGKNVTGSASRYGSMCEDCDGTTAARKAEVQRWASLTLEQKVEELKQRLDSMGPAANAAWQNMKIG